jgi:hypothetical protein
MTTYFSQLTIIRPSLQNLEKGAIQSKLYNNNNNNNNGGGGGGGVVYNCKYYGILYYITALHVLQFP